MKLHLPKYFLLVITVISIIGLQLAASQAAAQTNPYSWSYPVKIDERQGNPSEPLVLADPSGMVHLFWIPYAGSDSVIYYTSWDGERWSDPIDILAGADYRSVSAAIDPQGYLHLVWSDPTAIYYSQAYAAEATSPLAWSPPMVIGSGYGHPRIISNQDGNLYIAYVASSFNPVVIQSTDGGYTWSEPSIISLTVNPSASAEYPTIAISPNGTLHATWTEYQLPQGVLPLGIYYARSNDGGVSWSNPQEIAGFMNVQSNIVADGDQTIHVAWNGAAGLGGRYHRYSSDGGRSWSATVPVIPAGLGGSEGIPPLAVDSAGALHLVTTYGQRVWYCVFQDGRWSDPQYIPTGDETGMPPLGQLINASTDRHIEHASMALNGGNQLHLIFWDERIAKNTITFWYITRQSTAASTPLQPFPTQVILPTYTPSATNTPAIGIPENDASLITNTDDNLSNNPGWPILIGIAPVLLLAIGLVIWTMYHLNKR